MRSYTLCRVPINDVLYIVVDKLNFNQMLIGPKKPCAGFYAFIIIANSDIVALSIKKFPKAIEFFAVNIPVLGNLSIIVKLCEFHQLRRSSALLLWFGHTKM